ncbi:MAG: glycosyltransferase family 2 protein [Porphyromonas sp.]|nr:glycosyltransferase family 2 protein [Porphyromonas sp.]
MRPKSVAVLISTYNWPRALELAMEGLFKQTRLPDEIIIADDGSGEETQEAIKRIKELAPKGVVLKHVWHEDLGFRRSMILNRGIAAAESDYIIELDGDCIPEKHFVADHLNVARENTFVTGSRVKLDPESSVIIQEKGLKKAPPKRFTNSANAWRIPFIQNLLAPYYKQKKIFAVRGCNLAFWRKDLLAVNGYDDSYVGWGHEDIDIVSRLRNMGLRRRFLKGGGVIFHLYHKEEDRSRDSLNKQKAMEVIATKKIRAEDGLDKYINAQKD